MAKKNTDKNERNTENLVRNALRDLDYYDEANNIRVEEQKSVIDEVKRLLKNGSKSAKGGRGYPAFLVSNADTPDFLIVYECKASVSDHESASVPSVLAGDDFGESEEDAVRRIKRYAVDGALHYAKLLSQGYNVIAVAVSGENKTTAKKSVYLHSKGAKTARPMVSANNGNVINEILPWMDFLDHAVRDPAVRQAHFEDVMAWGRELHALMRDHAKLTESEKLLLVSGTLIALQNRAFAASYGLHDAVDLPNKWIEAIKHGIDRPDVSGTLIALQNRAFAANKWIAIKHGIDRAEIPQAKKGNIAQSYASVSVHPELAKKSKEYPKGILYEIIKRIIKRIQERPVFDPR